MCDQIVDIPSIRLFIIVNLLSLLVSYNVILVLILILR